MLLAGCAGAKCESGVNAWVGSFAPINSSNVKPLELEVEIVAHPAKALRGQASHWHACFLERSKLVYVLRGLVARLSRLRSKSFDVDIHNVRYVNERSRQGGATKLVAER